MSIWTWILSAVAVDLGISMLVGLAVGKAIGSMTTDALRFLEGEQWTSAQLARGRAGTSLRGH